MKKKLNAGPTLIVLAQAIILAIALTGLTTGCAMFKDKKTTCDTAAAALGAYHAVIAAGSSPSPTQIQAAAGATAFLTAYCGWTETRGVDANGVPIILPPR